MENGYSVQYFERNRFEYHPEFAGTPNEVLLGLLGSEVAQQQRLDSTVMLTKTKVSTSSFVSVLVHTGKLRGPLSRTANSKSSRAAFRGSPPP